MDGPAPEVFLFEGFQFDRAGGCLLKETGSGVAEPLSLGSRAIALLTLLLERRGKLVTKDEIFAAVWPGTAVEEANLTVQISALRRILDQDRERSSCIQTVPGRGYRFVASVRRMASSALSDADPQFANGAEQPIAKDEDTLSSAAAEQIRQEAPAALSRGRYQLRRVIIAAVAGVLCIAAAMVAALNWRLLSSWEDRSAPRLSIVVLPFANLNNDFDQQYFVDALTEDLTTELARMEHMYVISRSTALSYRDKPVDVKQIGRELAVRYVLEGGVQRSGERIRVNAQLIDAVTDAHLWADRFDRDTGDLFALQNEITLRVANTLNVTLEAVEAGRTTAQPDVVDLILRGRALWRKWPVYDNYAGAISSFEHALALDPHSVEAQTWLARVLVQRVLRQQATTAAADIARADELIRQALLASPLSWQAHYVRGQVLTVQNRCGDAIPEFERVIALNRNFQSAYANLGWCKFWMGSIEEAVPLQEKAIRFHHADPFLSVLYWRIGVVRLVQSRIGEAIITFEKARSINPNLVHAHAYLAAAYGLDGEIERAAAALVEARKLSRDNRYSSIAQLEAIEKFGVPKLRTLFEKTYLVGLRKAGMPEE
jgi:TolB-like protein/DNA-binding winged helix-turn-helix (wHTH) protein/Tfp pilus assembly protein PilF